MSAEPAEARSQGDEESAEGAGGLGRGQAPGADSSSAPGRGEVGESEVSARPHRRHFPAAYKLKIVEAAERCLGRGEIGALLRREGLYSSQLTKWRREALAGLAERQRGRRPQSAERRRNEQLEREVARLQRRLEQAEAIIEVQKKVSALLGITLPSVEHSESD
jgi:transposase-like protein